MGPTHVMASAPTSPVVVVVMDGVGVAHPSACRGDAVTSASTPTLDALRSARTARTLRAHGLAAGLASDSVVGNSEVGHTTIGCGRIIDQGAKLVDDGFASGSVFRSDAWRDLVSAAREEGAALHLIGLLSDGGVHSHVDHVDALIAAARAAGIARLRCHVLLDGRDVMEGTAEGFVAALEETLRRGSEAESDDFNYRIASGGGRMIATMDRYEADWGIVRTGWEAHVLGSARPFASAAEALATLRGEGHTSDQRLPAWSVVDGGDDEGEGEGGRPIGAIHDGDAVLFWNFRADRALQITRAFVDPAFDAFDRIRVPRVVYAGIMRYDNDLDLPPRFLVEPPVIDEPMGELLARAGVAQWACAETHKFGHITRYWNGNRAAPFEGETHLNIPSAPGSADARPEMRCVEVADALIAAIEEQRYRFLRINLANGDMVGHTGNFDATVLAMEHVDRALGRVRASVAAAGGILVVTADHGNAERMLILDEHGAPVLDESGTPIACTQHSTAPVPYTMEGASLETRSLRTDLPNAGLANIASTLMELLGVCAPAAWEPSLLMKEVRK